MNTYTWDANGNPKGSSYTIGAGNRLESDGTWNFVYDDEGNLTSKIRIATGETWEYNYNHENRLVGVTKRDASSGPAVLKVWFKYDVQGNRIEKTVDPDGDGPQPAATENFTYTEDGNAWADLDASGNITTHRMYLDAVDALFARIGSGDPEWYLTDHLGSVRQIADSSGTILDEITYDGFGAILSESSPTTGDRYKYTSREWDAEIDIQYNRARYYDPATRRWISQDPLGFDAGDGNLYRYVKNEPVGAKDSSGLAVIFLLNTEGANGLGHAAVLVGRDGKEAGWTYFSFTLNAAYTSSDNITVKRYASLKEAAAAKELQAYDKYIYYGTTPAQERAARQCIGRIVAESPRYRFFT